MPSLEQLFRIQRVVGSRPLAPGEILLQDAGGGVRVPDTRAEGVFVTEQSLLSFPGAAAGVAVLSAVVGQVSPSLANSSAVALACTALVGFAIFGVSVAKTWKQNTVSENARSIIVGLINTGMLFLAATGVDAMFGGAPSPQG